MAFKTFEPATRGRPLPHYGSDDFSFSGTASRLSYWIMLILSMVFNVTLAMVALKLFGSDLESEHPPAVFAIVFPFIVGLFWYQLATFVRRLRDRGWSNATVVCINIGLAALMAVPYGSILVLLACLWLFIECGFLGSAD